MVATEEKLVKVLVKNKGVKVRAAKELGITPEAITKRLRENPELKQTIQDICRRNLEKAGASMEKIFKVTAEGLDAVKQKPAMKVDLGDNGSVLENAVVYEVDYKERREAAKLCHLLIGNLQEDKQGPTSTGPIFHFYLPQKDKLAEEIIDVASQA